MQEHYTDDEAKAILSRAVERHAMGGGMTRAQLEQIAAEIGVSKEALARAETEWVAERGTGAERQAFEAYQRNEVLSLAIKYTFICAFLCALDLFMAHRITWSMFPVLGMALAFGLRLRHVIVRGGEEYEREFQEWRERQRALRNG